MSKIYIFFKGQWQIVFFGFLFFWIFLPTSHAQNVCKIGPSVVLRSSHTQLPVGSAVWVHPDKDKVFLSLVFVTDEKSQTLSVYDLEGRLIEVISIPLPGSVDVRYNFPLGGKSVDIVAVLRKRNGDALQIYRIDPDRRQLIRVDDDSIFMGKDTTSGCLYHSIRTNRFFWVCAYSTGIVQRFELKDNGQGKISANKSTEKITLVSGCDGVLADDDMGILYLCERTLGVWALGGDPEWKGTPKLVIKVGMHGLERPVRRIGLYPRLGMEGYLVILNEPTQRFIILDRKTWNYVGVFLIHGGMQSNMVTLLNYRIGSLFPEGIILASVFPPQERPYTGIFSWKVMAEGMEPPLKGGPSWDPRDPLKRLKVSKEGESSSPSGGG